MDLETIKYPSPNLVTPTLPVIQFGRAIMSLGQNMLDHMEKEGGAGLASNQIGSNLNLFVSSHLPNSIICNPTWKPMTDGTDSIYITIEGCLSFPGWFVPLKRHSAIIAEWQDWSGKRRKKPLYMFQAQIFQHEVEHLEGRTFLEHLTIAQQQTIRNYFTKK